jgi:hypothetical protein
VWRRSCGGRWCPAGGQRAAVLHCMRI